MAKKKVKKTAKRTFVSLLLLVLLASFAVVGYYYYILHREYTPKEEHTEKYYYSYDFGFLDKKSEYDYNKNGVDDYTEYLKGMKDVAEENPKYISKYYAGGYPPIGEGVCTDVVWRALKEAGYYLKDMIDQDIKESKSSYNIDNPDPNIDFRRVSNQEIFFKRYAESLDTDIKNIKEFSAGDIITFDNSDHIAMISDKRNANGVPYLIQNGSEEQKEKEEDRLEVTPMKVTGHYRFTYSPQIQKLINKIQG